MKAHAGTEINKYLSNCSVIAITAPNEPPADTPMIPGAAIGFRKSACIVTPATLNPIPTKIPTMILGKRSSVTINDSRGVCKVVSIGPIDKRTLKTFASEIGTGPTETETNIAALSSTDSIETPSNNLARNVVFLSHLVILLNK